MAYISFVVKYSVFSWHPFLLSVGVSTPKLILQRICPLVVTFNDFISQIQFLMGNAILAMNRDSVFYIIYRQSSVSRNTRILIHWILHGIGVLFVLFGTLAEIIVKVQRGKLHLQSVHTIVGAIAVVAMVAGTMSGVLAKFSWNMRNYCRPNRLKVAHIVLGFCGYVLAVASIATGYDTGYYLYHSSVIVRDISIVFTLIAASIVLWQPTMNVFARFK